MYEQMYHLRLMMRLEEPVYKHNFILTMSLMPLGGLHCSTVAIRAVIIHKSLISKAIER